MFPIGGARCPVFLFDKFVEKRPLELKNSGPFYLTIKRGILVNDDAWFIKTPMGKIKISGFMKCIIRETSLAHSGKKLTNHSARKTAVKKLKAEKFQKNLS